MTRKRAPEFMNFLTTYLAETDPTKDDGAVQAFVAAASLDLQRQVISQGKLLCVDSPLSIEEVGMQTNRWFGDAQEACAWFSKILTSLESAQSKKGTVKDSNGALLAEGDSVQVIKDLKVKGGSSDLKRGTLIKNIHLIDDAENIECRLGGSTLVLKTCFLKKA